MRVGADGNWLENVLRWDPSKNCAGALPARLLATSFDF